MSPKYISVLSLNKYLKSLFDNDRELQSVYIKGEISNYRPHPSGHVYFTLKDEKSRISAVMFASVAKKLDFKIENGMEVLIHARVSIYETSGQYQLYVMSMQQDGIGKLFLEFEKLKKKLEMEGLFDNQHKKEIPHFPKKIAILSAKQGAALQDTIKTIYRRFPFVQVIIFPIPVQGLQAPPYIINTLKFVDQHHFDTIILARGGGSIEDLWAFNNEELARTLFQLETPIITGVGHETDFTLCDFVSDYRAETPTAAAVKATPDQRVLNSDLQTLTKQLAFKMNALINREIHRFEYVNKSYLLHNPEKLCSDELLRLITLNDQLKKQFELFYIKNNQTLENINTKLKQNIQFQMSEKNNHFVGILNKLDALSPIKVLERGYSLASKEDQLIRSIHDVKKDDHISIQVSDGHIKAKVE